MPKQIERITFFSNRVHPAGREHGTAAERVLHVEIKDNNEDQVPANRQARFAPQN